MFNFDKQNGQASRLLLVLAVVVLVAVVITFLIIKWAEKPPAPVVIEEPTAPEPVYKQTLGNIKLEYQSAIDRGNILSASQVVNSRFANYAQKSLTTGEKFIQVTIGAQNVGTENIPQGAWGMGNLIDAEGRNFVAVDDYLVAPWISDSSVCGAMLKPAFDPTSCTKIYEVAKTSSGFRLVVLSGKGNMPSNLSSGKVDSFLMDLIIK